MIQRLSKIIEHGVSPDFDRVAVYVAIVVLSIAIWPLPTWRYGVAMLAALTLLVFAPDRKKDK